MALNNNEMKFQKKGKGKSFNNQKNKKRNSFSTDQIWLEKSWGLAGLAFWEINENGDLSFSNDMAGNLLSKPGQTIFRISDIASLMSEAQQTQFFEWMEKLDEETEHIHQHHISINLSTGLKFFHILSFVSYAEDGKATDRFGLIIDETETVKLQTQLETTHEFAKIGAYQFDCVDLTYKGAVSLARIFFNTDDSFEFTQRQFFNCIHPEDLDLFQSIQNAAYDEQSDHFMIDFRFAPVEKGTYRFFRLAASVSYTTAGIPVEEHGLIIDQTEQKEREISLNKQFDVLSKLTLETDSANGEAFFVKMIRELAQSLNASYAFLYEKAVEDKHFLISTTYSPTELNDITLSDLQINQRLNEFIGDNEREILLVADHFYNQETNSPFDMQGMNGYAVLKLRNSDRDCIGLLSIITPDPITDFEMTFYILKAFGIRFSVEIERQRNQNELKETIQSLRIAANCAQLSFWSYTPKSDTFAFDFQNFDVLDQPAFGSNQINSKVCFSTIHPEDRGNFQMQLTNCIKKEKKRIDITCRIFTQRKDWLWVKIQGEATLNNTQQVKQIIGYVNSIDSLKRAEQKASENANRLSLALTAGNMGTFDIDIPSMSINVDETWQRIFGYKPAFNLLSNHDPIWVENVVAEDHPRIQQFFDDLHGGQSGILAIEFRFSPTRNFQSDLKWFRLQTHIVERDLQHKPLRAIGFVQEITKNKVSFDQLKWIANHDPITGLPNDRMMKDIAQQHCEEDILLFLIDLGHVQQINELYTFQIGNEYLQEISNRIRFIVGEKGIIARLQGVLFAILMVTDDLDPVDPKKFSQKLFRELKQPVGLINNLQLSSSIKIGISGGLGKNYQQVFQEAQEALNSISMDDTIQKSYIQLYSEQSQSKTSTESDLLERLFDSIKNHTHWELNFQPIINAVENRLIGLEALIRWTHPQFKSVNPEMFLAITEENGLMIPLGDIILDELVETVHWLSQQMDLSKTSFWFSTNVSPQQLLFGNYSSKLADRLSANQIPPSKITIEITNDYFQHDSDLTQQKLAELKNLGVKLALDDFKNDFSTLQNLQPELFDIIKIDQKVVKNLLFSVQSKAAATSALALGKSMGISTITEGIETQEQFQLILDMGGQTLQGYLFGKPITREELIPLIQQYSHTEAPHD